MLHELDPDERGCSASAGSHAGAASAGPGVDGAGARTRGTDAAPHLGVGRATPRSGGTELARKRDAPADGLRAAPARGAGCSGPRELGAPPHLGAGAALGATSASPWEIRIDIADVAPAAAAEATASVLGGSAYSGAFQIEAAIRD